MITRGRDPMSGTDREREEAGGRILIEIMGPAGAGKTTLLRALCSQDERISAGLALRKTRYVRPFLRRVGGLLPIWILSHGRDRWLDRREMRSITRLETWCGALEKEPAQPGGAVAIFDHGPLYRLARLREFGPKLTRSEPFQRWWRGSWHWWFDALDVVVMLEAPDAVLLQRIDERGHWFLGGDHPSEDKEEFLARYRRALSQILEAPGPAPRVLRFRTDEISVSKIAAEVLTVIWTMRATRVGEERSRR